jgi:response regulator RpfG family c-di-GMP phosphodiesterase
MSSPTDQLVPVKCNDLEIGMYIAELDRSWLHTPFTNNSFLVTRASQIQLLRRYCDYVYVDPQQCEPNIRLHLARKKSLTQALVGSRQNGMHHDLNDAQETLHNVTLLVSHTIHEARRNGRIDLQSIFAGLIPFLNSTLKTPDGMQWLLATEPMQGFLNRRALGTSMLCILFGKHLGLGRQELINLALGGLLLDIGKVSVPITILAKPDRLSKEEKWFTTRHVRQSLALTQLDDWNLDRAFSMIAAHHERLDGSGYPNRMAGTDIPLYARIAGIVDTFDALTLNRRYASARSGYSALRLLRTLRRTKFDAALVDEFIDSMGTYPTGTNVLLDDGSMGIVFSQNNGQPQQPNILLTNNTAGQSVRSGRIVTAEGKQPIAQAFPAAQYR